MQVIFGSAGFAKEVDWLMEEINKAAGHTVYSPQHFVGIDHVGEVINGKLVITEADFQIRALESQGSQAFIAVGSPLLKSKIHNAIKDNGSISYPLLVHPGVLYDKRKDKVSFGEGTIVCGGVILTTDVQVGKFVHLNLHVTVGHDSSIGDFTTVSPGAHISGNVHIGREVFIGTGAVLLERLSVCDHAVIGAGSVVTKSFTEPGTYVGMPAKKIK